jgi:Common central domain of tyrosinase
MRIRRLLVVAVILSIAANASAQRVRKHIEDLSKPELDALADAFQHLKANGELVRWADIHGVAAANSGCEHNSELLWPWHRAYLIAFEDALRASNPPVTSNVTIPYWDWSEPPTGSRYPKAFETIAALQGVTCDSSKDKCSPPVVSCRKVCPNPASPVSPALVATIQATPTWRAYGGGLKDEGIKGALESEEHDFIHGTYMGGLNRNTVRAARDPLFWAHHAFMDKLWAEWQAAHPGPSFDPVCRDCDINFLPGKHVRDYFDIAKLGVSYQPRQKMMLKSAKAAAPLTGLALPKAAKVVEVPVPAGIAGAKEIKVVFHGVTVPTDASYVVEIYLRPAGSPPQSRSEADALAMFSMWEAVGGHAGHVHETTITLDVTRRLHEITRGHEKTKWVLQIQTLRSDDSGAIAPVMPGPKFGWKSAEIVK